MLNIIREVLNLIKDRESFSRDNISQILLNLHSQFDLIQRIKSVLKQNRLLGQCRLVSSSEIISDQIQNITINILFSLQCQLSSINNLSISVDLNIFLLGLLFWSSSLLDLSRSCGKIKLWLFALENGNLIERS